MKKLPNIIYIHSHDTGRYIEPYGHAVSTPNLQKLAEDGVLFRQNFCVNPTCCASRASLLTGSYPHENGMTGLAHRGFSLNDYNQHVIHTLKKAGYTSVLAGVQHIALATEDKKDWEVIGYDRCLGSKYDGSEGAIEFLAEIPSEPFFLTVGFSLTHRPFEELEKSPDNPNYCLPPAPLPDTRETREDMARFKASAHKLDKKIGEVLEALDRSGSADNTLVICTTDHGIPFPHMKCNLTDGGIGTMLIMRGPGGFTGGKVVDSMVSHLDIFPTLCKLADLEEPSWLRGKSLLPLMEEGSAELHEELFFEVNYHAAYDPMRAVRTKEYKYIRRFEDRENPVLVNCDPGESKFLLLEQDWANKIVVEESLFNLHFDPNEMCNLAKDFTYASILEDMRKRLNHWMVKTNDPLLNGPVPAPEGAKLNKPSDVGRRG
jgi:N-sulfoglucosamine sulfohydrolase